MKKFILCSLMVLFAVFTLAQVAGTATEVDKYGNVHTDILENVMVEAGFEIGDMLVVTMGDTVLEVPFVTTYGDVDRGNPLVRISGGHVLLAANYGNFSKSFGLEAGEKVEIALVEKSTYKEEIELRHLVRTDERNDYASDAIFANFREVTIGNIAKNKLYRSSHPSMDDPRAPYSSKLVEAAGIKTVVNLSDSDEELAENYSYSEYYKSLGEKGNVVNLNMGVDLVSDEFAQKLKEGLLFIVENEPPYLVHCVEGKDRAGMVVAILGAVMGASTEEIYNDYATSYKNYYNVEEGTLAYDAVRKIIVDIFKTINNEKPVNDKNIMVVAIDYLLDKVELSPDEIVALREKLK